MDVPNYSFEHEEKRIASWRTSSSRPFSYSFAYLILEPNQAGRQSRALVLVDSIENPRKVFYLAGPKLLPVAEVKGKPFSARIDSPLFSAYASPGGTISGTVKGEDGAPFRAAFVRAQNVKTKMTMMVLSDNHGNYSTDQLPAGTYEVWATSTGYKSDPARRSDITVEDGKTADVRFHMKKSAPHWNQLTKYQAGILLPDLKGKRCGSAGMF